MVSSRKDQPTPEPINEVAKDIYSKLPNMIAWDNPSGYALTIRLEDCTAPVDWKQWKDEKSRPSTKDAIEEMVFYPNETPSELVIIAAITPRNQGGFYNLYRLQVSLAKLLAAAEDMEALKGNDMRMQDYLENFAMAAQMTVAMKRSKLQDADQKEGGPDAPTPPL